uniref:AVID protein n=1 Tax=Cyanistes caeruleus TaxID=156563 RepID=A0A8C0U2G5_CYACU
MVSWTSPALPVLLLNTAQATHTTPGPQCDLQGLWRNEPAGNFSGPCHTTVAATNKQILVSPLQGVQQHPSAKRHPTFGVFTVQRQFSDSTTAFVGQFFVDHCGEETLETVWLLQEKVLSHKDTWKLGNSDP